MASVSKTAKDHDIDNSIPKPLLENAAWIGNTIYDKVIEHFNVAPIIWALYRCGDVNSLVGGDPNSWHKLAAAIDLDYDHLKLPTNSQLFYFLANNVEFDKLIWESGNGYEPGWVHIQAVKGNNDHTITLAYKNEINGRLTYKPFDDLKDFEQFKKQIYRI